MSPAKRHLDPAPFPRGALRSLDHRDRGRPRNSVRGLRRRPPGTARLEKRPKLGKERLFPRRGKDVHFAFDKYSLTEYAKASLDSDVTAINKLAGTYPSLKVDVAGHTDWIGTDAYNQALSERRASAVKDYLVRKGVDSGRIRTYAYGESQPVAPNTTAEGRALNRRAEISTKGE